jgi:hypothetical protein
MTATSGSGACALLSNGIVHCWGRLFGNTQTVTSDDAIMGDIKSGLVASRHAICAIRTDDSVGCYYDNGGRPHPPSGLESAMLSASPSGVGMCSLLGGAATCWSEYQSQATIPAAQTFTQLALTSAGTLGLHDDGTLAYWGQATAADNRIPAGERFSSVTGAAGLVCGLRESDGTAVCWGGGQFGQADVPAALQ